MISFKNVDFFQVYIQFFESRNHAAEILAKQTRAGLGLLSASLLLLPSSHLLFSSSCFSFLSLIDSLPSQSSFSSSSPFPSFLFLLFRSCVLPPSSFSFFLSLASPLRLLIPLLPLLPPPSSPRFSSLLFTFSARAVVCLYVLYLSFSVLSSHPLHFHFFIFLHSFLPLLLLRCFSLSLLLRCMSPFDENMKE